MTYGIFSFESRAILESYGAENHALEAAARILRSEPDAAGSFALVVFDDEGAPRGSLEGQALLKRVKPLLETRQAAHA